MVKGESCDAFDSCFNLWGPHAHVRSPLQCAQSLRRDVEGLRRKRLAGAGGSHHLGLECQGTPQACSSRGRSVSTTGYPRNGEQIATDNWLAFFCVRNMNAQTWTRNLPDNRRNQRSRLAGQSCSGALRKVSIASANQPVFTFRQSSSRFVDCQGSAGIGSYLRWRYK